MARIPTDTKNQIRMAAFRLFLEKGYREVSYTDLIAATGMSKGAIYHHFSSKEALLNGVIEMLLEVAGQTDYDTLLQQVNSINDFRTMFLQMKNGQIQALLDFAGGTEVKVNKILFFTEVINESERLMKMVNDITSIELEFIEKCFSRLCDNGAIPEGKPPQKLAASFYWMMQGIEMKFFISGTTEYSRDLLGHYSNCLDDFFAII